MDMMREPSSEDLDEVKTGAQVASAFSEVLSLIGEDQTSFRDATQALNSELVKVKKTREKTSRLPWFVPYPSTICFVVLPVLLAVSLILSPVVLISSAVRQGEACLSSILPILDNSDLVQRELNDCRFCEGLTEVPKLSNLSIEDFVYKYAYSGKPIMVSDATDQWPARKQFTYQFFKKLYVANLDSLDRDAEEGQFFSYRSDVLDLYDLFMLSDERAALRGKKWYIGWSTADSLIGDKLRNYFAEPYFIPPQMIVEDDQKRLAWIFMGSPGPGAFMHLDTVLYPSWQAQLRGKKTWMLVPPPDCETVCQPLNATMETGDMILVDTNLWFHATFIHPGSISITIGMEYD